MSFGSVIGAVIIQKNDKRARSSKIDRYINNTGGEIEGVISHRQPTPEEIEELKQRLKAENKKHHQKVIFLTVAVMFLLSIVVVFFLF